MKDKIIKSIGFFAGLFMLLFVFSLLIEAQETDFIYDKTSVRIKIQEVRNEPENSLQVVFLGDSVCYSSFSPKVLWEEFGITSYVCASSAQRLCDSYAIIKNIFDTQHPKIIVLEATCLYRDMDIDSCKDDYVLDVFNRKIPIVSNHSDWKDIADKAVKVKTKVEKKSIKGFVVRETVNAYTGGEYMIPSEGREGFPNKVEDYLNKIYSFCNEKNVELVIVSSPSPYNWNCERANRVNDWAKENGVTYIDYNSDELIDIDWNIDTKDGGDHLNINGAEKVSKCIGQYLKETYSLRDLRNDEKYERWLISEK